MKKEILIIEDDEEICNLINRRLDKALYNVDIATCGKDAMDLIVKKKYDLVTIDLMLPDCNGMSICEHITKHMPSAITIIISAIADEINRLDAYKFGADDYICKPFSPKELALKILAHFRRTVVREDTINFKDIALDRNNKCLKINGFDLHLTPSEFCIFDVLYTSPKLTFTRESLAEEIFYTGLGEIYAQNIDSHIAHIRKKYAKVSTKEYIVTVRNVGYTFMKA